MNSLNALFLGFIVLDATLILLVCGGLYWAEKSKVEAC